jgi:Na+/H+ antiporter NhaD/arsenite permease-like protein
MRFPTPTIATAIVFLLTYAGIALGRIPGFRLDRAGIALTGAALMMAIGAITPEEAYRAVNLDTLALLLGMMIVVAHLRLSGFFRLVTSWALVRAHSPLILLATVAVTAGAFSAFLVNDAVCLVMTPLVIEVTRSLRRDPVPYLLAVAMASNIGSVATITGNPQNMSSARFRASPTYNLPPPWRRSQRVGLVIVIVVLATLWWREFRLPAELTAKPPPARVHKAQLIKAVLVTLGVIAAFFAGVPVAMAAFLGGALLLVTRAIKAQKVYQEIDGSLLLMFAGLFVVVAAAEKILLTPDVIASVQAFHFANSYVRTFDTAVLSNVISNVPAVLALKPRPASHLARDCDECDASGQSHPGRIGRQPHCRRARPRRRHPPLAMGLLPRRNSDHLGHPRAWRLVAELIWGLNALVDLRRG